MKHENTALAKVLPFKRYTVFTQRTEIEGKEMWTSVLNMPFPKLTALRRLKTLLAMDGHFFYKLAKHGEAIVQPKNESGRIVFTLTEHEGECPPNLRE